MNSLIAGGVAVLLLLGIIAYQEHRIDQLQDLRVKDRVALKAIKRVNEKNQMAVNDCERIANENIEEAERARRASEQAAQEARAMNLLLRQRLEDLDGTNIVLVGDCPAAADPAFDDFLCSGPLGCS